MPADRVVLAERRNAAVAGVPSPTKIGAGAGKATGPAGRLDRDPAQMRMRGERGHVVDGGEGDVGPGQQLASPPPASSRGKGGRDQPRRSPRGS